MCVKTNFSYAKKSAIFDREVLEPVSENVDNISEGIIYANLPKLVNPLNATPSYINEEEYNLVNNYNIDLNNIPFRVKYFSPTYKNALITAENSIYATLGGAGGSEVSLDEIKNTQKDIPSTINSVNDSLKILNNKIKLVPYGSPEYLQLLASIMYAEAQLNTLKSTNKTLTSAYSSYRRILNMKYDMNNFSSIVSARNQISKAMSSAVLNYLKLDVYENLLNKQVELYERIKETYQKNFKLGLATKIEVLDSEKQIENAKATLNNTKVTKLYIKQLICMNLGYDLKDIDKLNFVEPIINSNYVDTINVSKDSFMAYNSNSVYMSILNDGPTKLKYPGSTYEKVFNERCEQTKNKVVIALENLYNNLLSKKCLYESSLIEQNILNLNIKSTEVKRNNNLVSDAEYLALKLQNLASELSIKQAKYDYITAINDYYYGCYGIVDIM